MDKSLADVLRERAFIEVPFSMSRKELEAAAEVFLEFLRLPLEEKEKLSKLIEYKNKDGSSMDFGKVNGVFMGYKRKDKKDGDDDNKEYFHYNRKFEQFLTPLLLDSPDICRRFVDVARNIYEKAEKCMKEKINELETSYPGLYDWVFPENGNTNTTLRFLSYRTEEEGDFIAGEHYDKGVATLAIAESHPGLRIGKGKGDLEEVSQREGQVIFFPSFLLYKFSAQDIFPSWHGVVQKKRSENEDVSSRWAIVMFAAPSYIEEKIEGERMHTPLELGKRANL